MKRVYSNQNKNKKKRELRKLVLAQLSKMRKKLKKEHPGMLERLGEVLEANKKTSSELPQKRVSSDDVKIDQDKNIEAVEKMLALKEDSNPNFEKAVKTMLSNHKN